MIRGWAQRSYLAADGWWADLILGRFEFLESYGFQIDEIAFHFKEHTFRYIGPRHYLVFTYSPGWLCYALLSHRDAERVDTLEDLIASHGHQAAPSMSSFGREEVTSRLLYWAAGLHSIALDVFD